MDSSSILSDEFTRLPTEKQEEEIGKLFILLGGMQIRREPNQTDEHFRNRTFADGLEKLPDDSKYKDQFIQNRIIPSMINDFKESSVNKQKKLMEKLSDLTDGLSIKKKPEESKSNFRIRFYSRLLHKLPPGSEFEMVEFARQVIEDESHGESDETDEIDEQQRFIYGTVAENQLQNLISGQIDYSAVYCDHFSRMEKEKQDEEIRKLFFVVGGIEIRRGCNESDEYFRVRTFRTGIGKLPDECEYKRDFFDNVIIPSLRKAGNFGFNGGGNNGLGGYHFPKQPLMIPDLRILRREESTSLPPQPTRKDKKKFKKLLKYY